MQEILSARKISKAYGDKKVLEDINVSLHKGEIVSLLGVSGVGKTTLFNILSGLNVPDSGSVVLYDGSAATDITGQAGHISYMLQKDMLLPHKTVIDNVSLPLVLSGMKKKQAKAEAAKYMDRFGLEGTEQRFPAELSGGMRQRAALLRTYLCGNQVALLDEPFSALDTITRASVQEWYLQVMEEIKLSTIFITHDIDEAILISDRILILKGQPAHITDEIVVKTPKPRSQEFTLTEEFLEYKKHIRSLL